MSLFEERERARTGWTIRGRLPKLTLSAFVLAVAVAVTLWLLLVPMLLLVLNSLRAGPPSFLGGPWTLRNYYVLFSSPFFYNALLNTVIISATSTLGGLAVAIAFAWLVERTDMPLRGFAWVAVMLPLAIPGVLFALSWMLLLAPRMGLINILLRSALSVLGVSLDEGPLNVQSVGGIVFLSWMRGVSTIFLMIVGAFRLMDPALEEAARLSGSPPKTVLRRITLPLLMPALAAAAIYSFVSHLESFEAPLTVGLAAGIFVLSTLIYFTARYHVPVDYGLSAAYAVFFMILMTALAYFYMRMIRKGERFAVIRGRGFNPVRYSLGMWRYPALGLFGVYFLLTLVCPLFVLVWASIMPYYVAPSLEAMQMISFDHYLNVATTPRFFHDLFNTVAMAIGAGVLTMAIALLISWLVVRLKHRAGLMLDSLTFVSYAIPGVVVALAMIFVYLQPVFRPLGIYGSIWIIMLGLATQYLAFATRATNAGLLQIHRELEEAASVSGASRLRTICKVTVPLLMPSLVAGWIWVAAHSLRTFSVPLVLASENNEVLSVWIWIYWQAGRIPEAAAIGVILILITAIMGFAARKLLGESFSGLRQ
ncbi:MAG TPA: iron ABC transporter permease [Candidatus Acidoferrales bacterium]|nr:iron ABC transporter permease [Candidatus Acidoferrales bacterium]